LTTYQLGVLFPLVIVTTEVCSFYFSDTTIIVLNGDPCDERIDILRTHIGNTHTKYSGFRKGLWAWKKSCILIICWWIRWF
jgi:hypothetical protein